MAADIATTLNAWSSTSSSNQPDTSDPVGPNTLAQNLQVIQSVMRAASAGDGTIASATTTDLSTVNDGDIAVTGTTAITGFGTLTAGIKKILTFSGALTLTHNATSLILPGAANITTAAGDVAIMRSLGSGNWRCISFLRAASLPAASGANADITSMTALTTINRTGGTAIKGTNTNDSAAVGYVGEYIESVISTATNAPVTATYGDLTSISLTAGDWVVSLFASGNLNTGTSVSNFIAGIGTASGASNTGLTPGDTSGSSPPPTSSSNSALISIPAKRFPLSATTTLYLKMRSDYGGGNPQFQGRISAVRVR